MIVIRKRIEFIVLLLIMLSIVYFALSKNVLRYKLFHNGDRGTILSIEQEYMAISNESGELSIYLEYDDDTIVFNEKWRKTDIDELEVGDFIESFCLGCEIPPEAPVKYYGEVIFILEKND